ncbi:maleylpyruvate isomerase N-terminal domain-containing protein [Nocardioides conyzicola]|uniref:Maleylpyruvate isomerase family mycothiol-dependent enzyme n=1 Tax=Nocardioides conyzicola TaxID=1651781 RepID=A0ABP8XFR3_9ACTN
MPTDLPRARQLEGLRTAMVALVRYADRAGQDAPVPTCPGWTVRDLVLHQGEAHRSTAAMLRGERAAEQHDPVAGDPLEWLRDGAIELVEALTRAPQEFWMRRACHQTTLHAVDALAAVFGRPPDPAETWIETDLAVDGIDELLTGFATRPTSRLRSDQESVLVVAPGDVPDWWLVRIGPRPAVATRGSGPRPDLPVCDWELDGPAVALYLALWDRSSRPMSWDRPPGPPGAGLTPAVHC